MLWYGTVYCNGVNHNIYGPYGHLHTPALKFSQNVKHLQCMEGVLAEVRLKYTDKSNGDDGTPQMVPRCSSSFVVDLMYVSLPCSALIEKHKSWIPWMESENYRRLAWTTLNYIQTWGSAINWTNDHCGSDRHSTLITTVASPVRLISIGNAARMKWMLLAVLVSFAKGIHTSRI